MRIAILLPLVLAGCAAGRSELARPGPVFSAERFFAGHTEGQGQLKIALSGAKGFNVHGDGEVEADGTLVLGQLVEREGKDPERREWRIRRDGAGYSGTLSDAKGIVRGEVRGNALHLRFTMTNGMNAEQWIYLQPGGRVALNRMTVKKFGVTVASIEETIRKTGE